MLRKYRRRAGLGSAIIGAGLLALDIAYGLNPAASVICIIAGLIAWKAR